MGLTPDQRKSKVAKLMRRRMKIIFMNISESFNKINSLYIADGHHRTASSARLSQNNNSKYFMSLLIDENQLNIFSFNRIVKNINTLIPNEFL